jgi:hypothetical protein
MASTTSDEERADVEFVNEPDGRVTARDVETGVASFGDTRSEALRMLADAIESHEAAAGYPDDDVSPSNALWL